MIPARRTSGRIRLSSALLGVALSVIASVTTGCGDSRAAEEPKQPIAEAGFSPVQPSQGGKRLLKDTPFERAWDLDLKKPVANSWILPELPDTIIFQLKGDNELIAVDALSGHTRWVSMALPAECAFAPGATHIRQPGDRAETAVYDDRLYLISRDVLFVFDLASGQLIWRYELPFAPSSSPKPVGVDSGLRVFIGDWAGRLQVVSYEPTKAFPYIAWQFNVGATVTAPAVESEDQVYANDGAGWVHAFKLDRKKVWSFKAGGRIDGAGAIRDRVLFVGTSDRVLYAINRLTGEKLGQVNLNAPLARSPLAFRGDGDRVYAWVATDQGDRGGMYAFTAQNDTVPFTDASRHPLEVVRMGAAWHLANVDRLVCSTPGHFYLTAAKSALVQAVDRVTGAVSWTWDVAEERAAEQLAAGVKAKDIVPLSSLIEYVDPTEMNRSVFAVEDNGVVVAYRFFGYVPPEAGAAKALSDKPSSDKPATEKLGGAKPAKGQSDAANAAAPAPAAAP